MIASIEEFLRDVYGDRPSLLFGINPNRDETKCRTFDDPIAGQKWAQDTNRAWGVYYHVNPVRADVKRDHKASKTDIECVMFLQVDIDPRTGEDRDAERVRILALLRAYKHKPTFIIDSGNGYQALWRLRQGPETLLDGTEERADALGRYSRQIANELGGDCTHDVSRVLRLPFLTNWVSDKKRKKGRIDAPTSLVEFNADAVYDLDDFTPAPAPRPKGISGPAGASSPASSPLPLGDGTPMDVDALRDWCAANGKTVSEVTLAIISTGEHPIEPGKYGSRSEPLFRVVCDLVRADVDRNVIFGVIAGPNAIGESVREKRGWKSYAIRQIERAEEQAIDPALLEMNDKHFIVLDHGGKTRVMTHVWDAELKREKLVSQTKDDLSLYYANERVSLGEHKSIPRNLFWLAHPRRAQFETMFFDPGKKGEGVDLAGHYNLWRGWAVNPQKGDWSLTRQLIDNILSGGNPEYADYILRWAAWAVQYPDRPAEAALVFRGGKGTGKGTFGRALRDVFGQHGMQVFSPSQVTGKFNAHLRDCCLLFADEAVRPGRDGGDSQLKGMITEPVLAVEGKGKDLVPIQNRLHVVMASNEDYVVPASPDERRYAVFDVPNIHSSENEKKTFFQRLNEQLQAGGLAAMLFDLLNLNLGDFHPRWSIPQTEALARQKRGSLTGINAVVFDLLCVDGWGPIAKQTRRGRFVATESLREYAVNWLGKAGGPEHHVSAYTIRELLTVLGCVKYRLGGGGDNGYLLPTTAEMRRLWNRVRFEWWAEVEEAEVEEAEPEELDHEPDDDDAKPPF